MEHSINTEINELKKRPEQKKKWQTPELKKASIEGATENGGATTVDGVIAS